MSEFEPNPMLSGSEPVSTTDASSASDQVEAGRREAIHDFGSKLRQPDLLPAVVEYVNWRRQLEHARANGLADPATPDLVPVSINLDLTTACNYRCDHCIDWDVLNSPHKFDDAELRDSLSWMAGKGLKSVILIGGGEPTLYPDFVGMVRFLKGLDLQVAVVTNGSRGDRLFEIAPYMSAGDWVRLSLDAGSNETFVAMHRPSSKTLSLEEICSWIPRIRAANPEIDLGFSFVITWKGGTRDDCKVIENMHEMVSAARLARQSQFSYISFKPFLERADDGSEIMDPSKTEADLVDVRSRIVGYLEQARLLERPGFRVMESTNLRMLEAGTWEDLTSQPRTCHMQALRQVLTPTGTFNCPAYRGVDNARIGSASPYSDAAAAAESSASAKGLLDTFDASHQCREVTCLYHATNWWIEGLIRQRGDEVRIEAAEDRRDFFL